MLFTRPDTSVSGSRSSTPATSLPVSSSRRGPGGGLLGTSRPTRSARAKRSVGTARRWPGRWSRPATPGRRASTS